MTSCATRKAVYYPDEVSDLSKQLKIRIENDDPNMPLFAEVSLWLGVPYKYGGNSKSGTDCSGFVSQVFNKVYSKKLQRSAANQASKDVSNVSKSKLKTGDLVFFMTTSKSSKISHVGIYLRDNYFIHASTSRGVIVSNLSEKYYEKNWKKGGRVK